MKHLKDDAASSPTVRTSSFILEGQFLGFVLEGSKLKYLRMALADSELEIKLSKQSRASLGTVIHPQDWIQVYGAEICDRHSQNCKLKAYQINRISSQVENHSASFPEVVQTTIDKEAETLIQNQHNSVSAFKILVCQKSGCQKKGAKQQQQRLKTALQERGLSDRVTFESTGCLGKCSMAPNTMLMPGKKRLSGMSTGAIVDLIR
uniref:(2Fe-2S) ferredoxin domain-containing protein n=1 Tax=Cyanothece sp. (strain PCC 7425 / ATCC 29141) TaxID=395961 RepID=B8HWF1_CYAP4